MTSATLSFYVQSETGVNYTTKTVRVYGKTSSAACMIGAAKDKFKGCGTLSNLGTVTVTSTGTYTFTIPTPESNISKTGRTIFVLVDDSTLTDPEGSAHEFVISTNEHGTAAQRPKLEVTYE